MDPGGDSGVRSPGVSVGRTDAVVSRAPHSMRFPLAPAELAALSLFIDIVELSDRQLLPETVDKRCPLPLTKPD